jgi:hypothetical protein
LKNQNLEETREGKEKEEEERDKDLGFEKRWRIKREKNKYGQNV